MAMQVRNKVVAITGAAGGLGAAIAHVLAGNGAVVWLLDMDMEKCQTIVQELRQQRLHAFGMHLDVACEQEWYTVVSEIIKNSGRIDVLINNAGINIRKNIEEMSMDEFTKMLQVNVGSVFLGTKAVIPHMREQRNGLIINMSSMCGLIGHKFTPEAYTATKGAVTMLTKSIASRYGHLGIRCNSIHPCTVDTPLVAKVLSNPESRRQRIDEVPLGRLATKEDVAYAALYLASDEASFLNGVALPVDGGVTCY
jgi:NAD(P)-dependent dehydrogenase (short-subunit alcohol dehydrogenase family)